MTESKKERVYIKDKPITNKDIATAIGMAVVSSLLSLLYLLMVKNAMYSFIVVTHITTFAYQALQIFPVIIVAILWFAYAMASYSIYKWAIKKSCGYRIFVRTIGIIVILLLSQYFVISLSIKSLSNLITLIFLIIGSIVGLGLIILSCKIKK